MTRIQFHSNDTETTEDKELRSDLDIMIERLGIADDHRLQDACCATAIG